MILATSVLRQTKPVMGFLTLQQSTGTQVLEMRYRTYQVKNCRGAHVLAKIIQVLYMKTVLSLGAQRQKLMYLKLR